MKENSHIVCKPWKEKKLPRRILVVRWQAMGDVVITLPYLQHLRSSLPSSVKLDLLTRVETEGIPKNIVLFDKVFSIAGERNFKKQLFYTLLLLPRLIFRRYDIVVDLQNNIVSRTLRMLLAPRAWSEFDKFSTHPAGERNRLTIEALGLGKNQMNNRFLLKKKGEAVTLLKNNGWNGTDRLVVLNPAGFFPTRNWPLENYVAFARLWEKTFPDVKFVILGTPFIQAKAEFFQKEIGDRLINLVSQTTPFAAFEILQQVQLVLSEDSGLMHMAWISGTPTLTLFGGTRSDWARPLGEHSFFLDSSDLPCGNCMQAACRHGNTPCLTRFSPEMIFENALMLIRKTRNEHHAFALS